jgi:hypothetical protein
MPCCSAAGWNAKVKNMEADSGSSRVPSSAEGHVWDDSGWTWVLNESTNNEVCLNENCDPTKRLTKFLFINVALPRHRGQEEITGLMKETRGNSPRKEVNSSIDRDLLGPVLHPLPPQCQSVAVDLGTILFMFNSSDRLSFSYHVLAYLIDRDRPLGQFL